MDTHQRTTLMTRIQSKVSSNEYCIEYILKTQLLVLIEVEIFLVNLINLFDGVKLKQKIYN